MLYSVLSSFSRKQIDLAGPRYILNCQPDHPNIDIPALNNMLNGLAVNNSFHKSLSEYKSKINRTLIHTSNLPSYINNSVKNLLDQLCIVEKCKVPEYKEIIPLFKKKIKQTERKVSIYFEELAQEHLKEPSSREVENKYNNCREILSLINQLNNHCEGKSVKLAEKNVAILFGQTGSGKTHFLCDLTSQRFNLRLPTLFCLAKEIPASKNPLEAFAQQFLKRKIELRSFLKHFNALGEKVDERAFLILDGINEGDFDSWCNYSKEIFQTLSDYPYIGLILSCRNEYQNELLENLKKTRDELHVVLEHPGLKHNILFAQREFFKHYKLDLPGMPLLNEEFSNPLTLRLICEGLQVYSKQPQNKTIESLINGQKTLVHLFEHYVKNSGEKLAKRSGWAGWSGKKLWNKLFKNLASEMAQKEKNFLFRSECNEILAKLGNSSVLDIVEGLVKEGMLIKSRVPGDKEDRIEFPYQALSDHLIVRELLNNKKNNYLNTTSEEAIRNSFINSSRLSRLIELKGHEIKHFNYPNLVAALWIELPERLKDKGFEDRELFAYLPSEFQSIDIFYRLTAPIFLQSLRWRNEETFSRATYDYINECLKYFNFNSHELRNNPAETLVCLAVRTSEELTSMHLKQALAKLSLSNRDRFWSEFLRDREEESGVYRILEWIKDPTMRGNLNESTAQRLIILVATFLTTTHKRLRDTSTEALFLLGLKYPFILFNETVAVLDFNDPYVLERMLSASYGVLLSSHTNLATESNKKDLYNFAINLNDRLLSPEGDCATTHALIRDYGYGVVQVIQRIMPESALVKHPKYLKIRQLKNYYPPKKLTKRKCKELLDRLVWGKIDFCNYTLGDLVPERNNYDHNHPEFCRVLNQIIKRVTQLGYSLKAFEEMDKFIRHLNGIIGNPKIEEYFKKYLWIAYYEMWGTRKAQGKIKEKNPLYLRDIDPTFPQIQRWSPKLENPFLNFKENKVDWKFKGPTPDYRHLYKLRDIDGIKGPWILLFAIIDQIKDKDDRRKLALNVHLLLSGTNKMKKLSKRFFAIENLRFDHRVDIPSGVFAGEIPLSKIYTCNSPTNSSKRILSPSYISWEEGLKVETLAHAWHTSLPPNHEYTLNAYFPSPYLCYKLGLVNHPQTFDLFEGNGKEATIFRVSDLSNYPGKACFLYIREDLIESYLGTTNKKAVWITQGERLLIEPNEEEKKLLKQVSQEGLHKDRYKSLVHFSKHLPKW